MKADLRKSGIEIIGEVPWGTHFCQFYQSKEDLIEILVPYFKQGLENNEFCMWVTSEPLGAEDAKKALKEKVKNLDEYIKKGQIEILDYSQWYTKTGRFDADKVLEGWVKKEEQAIERGFDGLRLTGNTFWLEKESWESFTNYEAIVNSVIGKHRMLAVCSYSLDKCQASEIVDVVSNHQFALIKKKGKWVFLESSECRKAQGALKASEEKYRSLVQNIPDVVWTTDINGKTIFISPNVKEIYGYTSEEIYKGGDSIWFDRIHPDDAEKVKGAFISLFEKGRLFDAEYRIQRKNKDWIWLHDRAINVYEKNGIKYADGVFLDITERKQAEVTVVEEKNKLEKYLSVIGAIVVLFDQGGKVLFINKNGCEILGHEIKDILNKDWFTNFVLEKDRTRATAVFEGLIKEKSDKTKYFKTHVLTKSGKQIAISWGSVVEKDEAGEIRTVLNTGIDITQLEDAKITINQLEELNKLKDDFLNIATHELKTPLTSIIGLSEVMNGQSQALNPESQKYINIINAEGHKLNHIIKRILRVTRFESDREIIFNEKINLKKVIFSFLPSLEVMANKKDVKIVIDIKDKNINLISDKEKISEVIYNLVDNAIKYGPGNQPITIAIHKPKKELVKIEVKDRGPGISPESQKKIFDKFVQLEPFLIRSRDGTGLGLYICKLIVNSLGGKIGVKSVLGKGSNFFFTLPIQKDIKS